MPRPSKPPRLYFRERKGREGTWVILDAGSEIGTGFGHRDRSGAEKELSRYLARKHKPKVGTSDPSDLLIADVLTYYLNEKKPKDTADARAFKSFDDLAVNIERLLEWWGGKYVNEIKGATCKAYAAHRQAQPKRSYKDPETAPRISAATARRELEDLSSAIGVYHKEFTLDAVPALTLPEKSQRRERWLTRTEVARLLWACLGWRWDADAGMLVRLTDDRSERSQTRLWRRHLARFILIGIYSGTRHMPIVRARWVPSVTEPYVQTDRGLLFRRGARERETSKRQPPVRIVPRLLAHMRRWERMDLERRGKDGSPEPATHVVHVLGRPLAGKIRTAWENACRDAGLGSDVVPHVMRHTSATWLMHGGAPISEAAGYLGMSEQTLRMHYQHHHPDYQDGMDQAFARARKRTANAPRIAQETQEMRRTKQGKTKNGA